MAGVLAWGGSTGVLVSTVWLAFRSLRSSDRKTSTTYLVPLGLLLFWLGMVLSNLDHPAWMVPFLGGATLAFVSATVRQPTPSPADDGTR